eukprot:2913388-Ditylum_brightwellii.AAC.1
MSCCSQVSKVVRYSAKVVAGETSFSGVVITVPGMVVVEALPLPIVWRIEDTAGFCVAAYMLSTPFGVYYKGFSSLCDTATPTYYSHHSMHQVVYAI